MLTSLVEVSAGGEPELPCGEVKKHLSLAIRECPVGRRREIGKAEHEIVCSVTVTMAASSVEFTRTSNPLPQGRGRRKAAMKSYRPTATRKPKL